MQEASSVKGKRGVIGFGMEPRVKRVLVAIFALLLVIGVSAAAVSVIRAQNRAHKVSVQKKAKATLNTGAEYYSKGKFGKAIPLLEKTIELDPGNAKAHLLLAQAYEATGEIDKAEAEYKTCIELDSSNPEVHYNLAIIYKSQGKVKEAISELEKAIKLRKDFVAARLILAELYAQQGEKAKAKEQYEAVIEMKPFGVDLGEVQKKLEELK
jgi:Tfp pilus assembly protein PilF